MLVSDAFSAGLMAIGVNSLKYSCRVMRPDGSSRNSFPSGHTATAFMAATMLHKEYGHRSPWYSIGGYTVATITGVTRQLNNRHWMSDIMVGAGIGILATELGYFLADLIFKEKGLNVTETYSVYDRCRRPSFLGFSLGFSTVPGSYTPYPGMHMQFLSGPAVSVQGAWFATPYWGFGGRMSCEIYKPCRTDFRRLERRAGFSFGTGLSTTYLATQNLGVRFSTDYDVAPPVVRSSRERLHKLTFSMEVCAVF